jgi:hypothetical protein
MNIDVNKIANYLRSLNVSENYAWKIPFNKGYGPSIFSQQELEPFEALTNFESNILLKTALSEKIHNALNINDTNNLKKIFEWAVHDWGGIPSGRQNIDQLYELGIDAIKKEKLNFKRIASTSKILSFYKPSEFIIYDSRIAYSLNAIMMFLDASEKYFPVPLGKNPKMIAFNIGVLIRLKHKANGYKRNGKKNIISNADKTIFFSEKEAYAILNNTVKEINSLVYQADQQKINKPFLTEMLLFSIADTIIYDSIIDKINITIEN